MPSIRAVALNILRAKGIPKLNQGLYASTISFDRLLAVGKVQSTDWPWAKDSLPSKNLCSFMFQLKTHMVILY